MTASLLALDNVSKYFGGNHAVSNVSFALKEGEIVGLIGPNGAGKTTLVNVITGVQRASAGRIRFGDLDVTEQRPFQAARRGLARTFQVVQLFAGMTVRENVMIAAHRFTRSGVVSDAVRLPWRRRALDEAGERADAALAFVGLEALAGEDVSALPIGQARMVELARALCLAPTMLALWAASRGAGRWLPLTGWVLSTWMVEVVLRRAVREARQARPTPSEE